MKHGPNTDYNGLYGKTKCKDCKYLRLSNKIEGRVRCDAPGNSHLGRLGRIFYQTPDSKNHLGRCEDYDGI